MSDNRIRKHNNPPNLVKLALARSTQMRAVKLAVVVGTALVLINQWEACFGSAPVQWSKAALTYLVPYLVSAYSSARKDYDILSMISSFD